LSNIEKAGMAYANFFSELDRKMVREEIKKVFLISFLEMKKC